MVLSFPFTFFFSNFSHFFYFIFFHCGWLFFINFSWCSLIVGKGYLLHFLSTCLHILYEKLDGALVDGRLWRCSRSNFFFILHSFVCCENERLILFRAEGDNRQSSTQRTSLQYKWLNGNGGPEVSRQKVSWTATATAHTICLDNGNKFKLHMNRESWGNNEVDVDTIYLLAASLGGCVPIRLSSAFVMNDLFNLRKLGALMYVTYTIQTVGAVWGWVSGRWSLFHPKWEFQLIENIQRSCSSTN